MDDMFTVSVCVSYEYKEKMKTKRDKNKCNKIQRT